MDRSPQRGDLVEYRGELYYYQPNGGNCFLYEREEDVGDWPKRAWSPQKKSVTLVLKKQAATSGKGAPAPTAKKAPGRVIESDSDDSCESEEEESEGEESEEEESEDTESEEERRKEEEEERKRKAKEEEAKERRRKEEERKRNEREEEERKEAERKKETDRKRKEEEERKKNEKESANRGNRDQLREKAKKDQQEFARERPRWSAEERTRVFNRTNGKCYLCKARLIFENHQVGKPGAWHMEHVLCLSKNPAFKGLNNILPACAR